MLHECKHTCTRDEKRRDNRNIYVRKFKFQTLDKVSCRRKVESSSKEFKLDPIGNCLFAGGNLLKHLCGESTLKEIFGV